VEGSLRALLARIERLEHARGLAPVAAAEPTGDAAPQALAAPAATPGGLAQAAAAQDPSAVANAEQPPELAAADDPSPGAAQGLESLRAQWPAVVELVRGEHALLGR